MRVHTAAALSLLLLLTNSSLAVRPDVETGSIKGKVRVESGSTAEGVTVIARRDEREAGRARTDRKGEFVIKALAPGLYTLTFRKPGLSVGTIEKVEVRAGKERSLGDRLILSIDEGTLAFLRGSVFNQEGRSVPGAQVELSRLEADPNVKKTIDSRRTNESGSFVFRLLPERARYRVTLKIDGKEAASKDVEIDGPAVYRIALSVPPATE